MNQPPPEKKEINDLLIDVVDLAVTFTGNSRPLKAIRDFNLQVRHGEIVALVGASGCGKTTVLRTLAGLVEPTEGSVSIGGLRPKKYRHKNGLGFCFQDEVMFEWRPVYQNLMLPAEISGVSMDNAHHHAKDLMQLMGLAGFEHVYPKELSGGMRQRLSLARSLLLKPELLLLDESFSAVDEITREGRWFEVRKL